MKQFYFIIDQSDNSQNKCGSVYMFISWGGKIQVSDCYKIYVPHTCRNLAFEN